MLNARPVTVVHDAEDLVATYLAVGTEHATPVFGDRMEGFDKAAAGDDLAPRGRRTWTTHNVLALMRPGDGYSPMAFRNEAGEFVCWYINLQQPFGRSRVGFDTMDAVLDIVVAPDMSSWRWKDEHELERVLELGLVSDELAQQIRGWGEQVIELIEGGDAWWTEWRDWAPDPSWPIPELPEGWDVM